MNLLGGAAQKAGTQKSRILIREVVSATKLGQKALARTLLKELQEEDPDNEQGLMWAAALAESQDEAMRHLQRAVELNPHNQQALNILAIHRLNPTARKPRMPIEGVAEPVSLGPPTEPAEARMPPPLPSPPSVEPPQLAPAHGSAKLVEFRELLKKGWRCPICAFDASQPQRRCSRCGVLFSFEDLQALAENRGVDERLVAAAIDQMEKKAAFDPNMDIYVNLARAHLNVNQSAAALNWLKKAAELQPADPLLRRVVRELERRRLILAVDDSQTLRRILSIMLERHGYRVLTAADGMQALARLNEQSPDLILLDITMPRMDGYQVCKVIKQNAYTKQIPVVMLSGNDGFFDKVKGKLAGATDYITKPFEEEELAKAVRKHMKPARTGL